MDERGIKSTFIRRRRCKRSSKATEGDKGLIIIKNLPKKITADLLRYIKH